MSKKNFDIFININSEKISIAIFKITDGECIFYKESDCLTNLTTDKLNFLEQDEEEKNEETQQDNNKDS